MDGSCDLFGDEAVGITIVRRALEEPLRQIAQNAGHEGAVVGLDYPRDGSFRLLHKISRPCGAR